jgi:flagellar protein FliL
MEETHQMKDKLVLILMGVLVLCMIGVGITLYVMWGKMSSLGDVSSNKKDAKQASESPELEKKLGPVYSLETFIVNLDDPKYKRYLRLTMDLELNDGKSSESVAQRLPQIRDAILKILPAKNYDDVVTAKGKNALRDEIINVLNSFFNKKLIVNIYFTEFVIQ